MKVALLTCKSLENFVTDETYLEKAIKDKGWSYDWIVWSEPVSDWNQYDVAIIRTTWDYYKEKEKFLQTLEQIEKSSCQLFNPFELVKWNSDKTYLMDLERWGVSTVPTEWVSEIDKDVLKNIFSKFAVDKIVVKPVVSAGAYKTYLISREDESSWEAVIEDLNGERLMIQPFLTSVAEEGEYSLHFFNNKLSHGILKKPKSGDFRSQEEFGSFIQRIDVEKPMLEVAEKVLESIKKTTLYARVDLIRGSNGFFLIELELIEPSLYFRYYEPSPNLMLEALRELLAL